ncbi:MAG TPA: chemotaxis protein CheD [Bryobacteraceae bacterium]|nr:chemotaxis protein CheD [Bryobacteraceae bacterium]
MCGAAQGELIVIGLGEGRVAEAPAALSTVALGSCVAVIAWDWKLKVGGLAHIMLPDSTIDPVRAAAHPYVFADSGLPQLLRSLVARGTAKKRLSWCLAGGATMMAGSAHFETGRRNEMALRKAFRKLGLFIEEEDLGGTQSRSVRLALHSGEIVVRAGKGGERILRRPAAVSLTQ